MPDKQLKNLNQELSTKPEILQAKARRTKENFKWVLLLAGMLGIAFLGIKGAEVYAGYLNKISPCSSGGEGICYSIKADKSGFNIKNLDENKKYRLILKKKVGDSEVELGSVDVDMKKLDNVAGHGETCTEEIYCQDGYVCKPSGRYGEGEKYCCKTNECASVIPTQGPIPTGVFSCVGEGGKDSNDFCSTITVPVCSGGLWEEGNCVCPDESNGSCDANCTKLEDPDC